MSQLLCIWSDSTATLPFDRHAAERTLSAAGWQVDRRYGVRRQEGCALALDILVPSTSGARRRLAEALQEMWRAVGVRVTVTAVDFPVFQERLGAGRFEVYIGAWLERAERPGPSRISGVERGRLSGR